MLLFCLTTHFCQWWGIGLSFCFMIGWLGFECTLLSVSFSVRFVLNSFSKLAIILLFSDWSVLFATSWKIYIIQMNSSSPSTQSKGFMFFSLVIGIFNVFLICLFSAFTVIFRRSFTWSFLISWYFLSSFIVVTGGPVSTISFSLPLDFFFVALRFFWWVTCCVFLTIVLINLSKSVFWFLRFP